MGTKESQAVSRPVAWLAVALIVFWAIEVLLFQMWSFGPDTGMFHWGWLYRHFIRLAYVGSCCWLLVLSLGRFWLLLLLAVHCLVTLGLVTYQSYFGNPLSLLTLLGQASEGAAVGSFALALVPPLAVVLLGGSLACKAAMCWKLPRGGFADLFGIPRRRLCLAAALLWCLTVTAMTVIDGPRYAARTLPFERIARTYSYTGAWTVELLFKDTQWMHDQIVAASEARAPTRWVACPTESTPRATS